MADVTQAVQYLMSLEGNPANHYYSNSPHDSGGETYMGISRRWHPNWEGWQFVDGLKGEKDFPACLNKSDALTAFVNDFYRVGWWDKYSLSFITDQRNAGKILAIIVNTGEHHGCEIVQKAINCMSSVAPLIVDGVIGMQTLTAINKCHPDVLNDKLIFQLCKYYLAIVDSNREDAPNFIGWIRRALS